MNKIFLYTVDNAYSVIHKKSNFLNKGTVVVMDDTEIMLHVFNFNAPCLNIYNLSELLMYTRH